jgi:hypothetical protein
MNLKSFGDSFIFGTDLFDADDKNRIASQQTWPALLAQHLDFNYKCIAKGGSGNLQILETVLTSTTVSNKSDLFVIGWTWINRFDYCIDTELDPEKDHWRTIRPADADPAARYYYGNLHSELQDKFASLVYIKLAIDALNQKGITFIMTYMDDLIFDQQWHTTPAITQLQEYILPYMTTFEGLTFLEWCRKNGYPESPTWHPLEAAHRAAGDYIIKVFDKQNIIDR